MYVVHFNYRIGNRAVNLGTHRRDKTCYIAWPFRSNCNCEDSNFRRANSRVQCSPYKHIRLLSQGLLNNCWLKMGDENYFIVESTCWSSWNRHFWQRSWSLYCLSSSTRPRLWISDKKTLRPIESCDAVVVNAPVIQWSESATETLPLLFNSRKRNQRIAFISQESPVYTWGTRVDPNKFQAYFNWTMTYRFDSDIPLSYGRKRAFKPMLEMRQKKKYFMFNNLIKFNPKIFSMLNLLNLYSFVVFDQFQD